MRLVRLVSLVPFALALVLPLALALPACGNGGGGDPDADIVLVDAPVPDAPLPIDAPPCTGMECDGVCVNTTNDELNCGSCGNACAGGETCRQSDCLCPGTIVPANPAFVFTAPFGQDQVAAWAGAYGDPSTFGIIDALIVAYLLPVPGENPEDPPLDPGTQVDVEYDLATMKLGEFPLIAAGYNVDLNTQVPDSVFYATAGTLVFHDVCAEGARGTATDVTFQGVIGDFFGATVDPEGCSFTVPSLTFAFGDACP